jgi:mono/diheme cytochrome c family protein
MLRSVIVALALILTACATTPPPSDSPTVSNAAPGRGLAYARIVCAECHAVEPGQLDSPVREAPAFEVIANLPGMTPTALNAWLHAPHPSMPNVIVAPSDRDDVAAYLNSLGLGAGRG